MRGGRGRNWGVLSGGQCDTVIRARHAEGYTDSEIARLLGVSREAISVHRRRLGLPSNRFHQRLRERTRQRTRQQLAAAGLKCLADYERIQQRKANVARGWPADVTPREVEILELLRSEVALSRQQICERLGMPWDPRKALQCKSVPGGGYLAHLRRLGLIECRPRWRGGKGQRHYFYHLAPDVRRRQGGCGASEGDASREILPPAVPA